MDRAKSLSVTPEMLSDIDPDWLLEIDTRSASSPSKMNHSVSCPTANISQGHQCPALADSFLDEMNYGDMREIVEEYHNILQEEEANSIVNSLSDNDLMADIHHRLDEKFFSDETLMSNGIFMSDENLYWSNSNDAMCDLNTNLILEDNSALADGLLTETSHKNERQLLDESILPFSVCSQLRYSNDFQGQSTLDQEMSESFLNDLEDIFQDLKSDSDNGENLPHETLLKLKDTPNLNEKGRGDQDTKLCPEQSQLLSELKRVKDSDLTYSLDLQKHGIDDNLNFICSFDDENNSSFIFNNSDCMEDTGIRHNNETISSAADWLLKSQYICRDDTEGPSSKINCDTFLPLPSCFESSENNPDNIYQSHVPVAECVLYSTPHTMPSSIPSVRRSQESSEFACPALPFEQRDGFDRDLPTVPPKNGHEALSSSQALYKVVSNTSDVDHVIFGKTVAESYVHSFEKDNAHRPYQGCNFDHKIRSSCSSMSNVIDSSKNERVSSFCSSRLSSQMKKQLNFETNKANTRSLFTSEGGKKKISVLDMKLCLPLKNRGKSNSLRQQDPLSYKHGIKKAHKNYQWRVSSLPETVRKNSMKERLKSDNAKAHSSSLAANILPARKSGNSPVDKVHDSSAFDCSSIIDGNEISLLSSRRDSKKSKIAFSYNDPTHIAMVDKLSIQQGKPDVCFITRASHSVLSDTQPMSQNETQNSSAATSSTLESPAQCKCPRVNIGMKDKYISVRVRDMFKMNVKDMLSLAGHGPCPKSEKEIAKERTAERNFLLKRKLRRLPLKVFLDESFKTQGVLDETF